MPELRRIHALLRRQRAGQSRWVHWENTRKRSRSRFSASQGRSFRAGPPSPTDFAGFGPIRRPRRWRQDALRTLGGPTASEQLQLLNRAGQSPGVQRRVARATRLVRRCSVPLPAGLPAPVARHGASRGRAWAEWKSCSRRRRLTWSLISRTSRTRYRELPPLAGR